MTVGQVFNRSGQNEAFSKIVGQPLDIINWSETGSCEA